MSAAHRFIRLLGDGLRLGVLVLSLFVLMGGAADAAVVKPTVASPIAKLMLPANSMADNMLGITYAMAGLAAIGLIIMSLLGRWPWTYFFAYIGSLAFLAIMPDFYSSIQSVYGAGMGYQSTTGSAQAVQLFNKTENLTDEVSASLKQVLYGVGAFGAIGIAAVSFLSGRFRWGWMMAMLGGLTLTAQLPDIISAMGGVPAESFANSGTNINANPLNPISFQED